MSERNAWRRAETLHEETGAEHHITPAWGQPVQCYGCVDRARQQLVELMRCTHGATYDFAYTEGDEIVGLIAQLAKMDQTD
ncbi:hypothetical protein [Streptomyces sp. NPDC096934]|uniref:hypothetical protein n=1 Tax=Streptomyces sp. NPDC096934 TaxID=3155551 RepID=UPI003330C118